MIIGQEFAIRHKLTLRKLKEHLPVRNVDGSNNKAGAVKSTTVQRVRITTPTGQFHEEQSEFYITTIGDHDIILGTDWLQAHNPEVDWKASKLKFTRCPSTCKLSAKEITAHPVKRKDVPTHISIIDPGPHHDHEAILARLAVHPFIAQQQLLKYHEPI